MTTSRMELQELLVDILGSDNVYFQPPSNIDMKYPCIVYNRDRDPASIRFANNFPYTNKKCYQVMVIDRNPDSKIPDKVAELPMCTFDRFFTADDLNHDVFRLFF
jgi:hypothetical protein